MRQQGTKLERRYFPFPLISFSNSLVWNFPPPPLHGVWCRTFSCRTIKGASKISGKLCAFYSFIFLYKIQNLELLWFTGWNFGIQKKNWWRNYLRTGKELHSLSLAPEPQSFKERKSSCAFTLIYFSTLCPLHCTVSSFVYFLQFLYLYWANRVHLASCDGKEGHDRCLRWAGLRIPRRTSSCAITREPTQGKTIIGALFSIIAWIVC